MGESTYKSLRQELRQLYRTKDYTQALELIEKEQANFPGGVHEISYWRITMDALLGKQEEALQIFRESLSRGDWFPPRWMEEDTDLISLQPLPEFQEMVEICRQRLAQAQGETRSALLVRQPTERATALPLLIALHGNSSNMHDTVHPWSGITGQGWMLAVPQSSQAFGPEAFVWDERETGISEIREHLAALNNEHKIDPERIVLGGFSMGGGQAIWMALHQSIKTCGFVVLGPYLRDVELEALPALLAAHKPAGLRGTILVGEDDVQCLAISRKVVEIMRANGLLCKLEVRPGMDHSYPADFAAWVTKELACIAQA